MYPFGSLLRAGGPLKSMVFHVFGLLERPRSDKKRARFNLKGSFFRSFEINEKRSHFPPPPHTAAGGRTRWCVGKTSLSEKSMAKH